MRDPEDRLELHHQPLKGDYLIDYWRMGRQRGIIEKVENDGDDKDVYEEVWWFQLWMMKLRCHLLR